MSKKYCCESFQWRIDAPSHMGLNIRVVQKPTKSLSFFITEGYLINSKKIKQFRIEFCPFCGKNLNKFYRNRTDLINAKIEDFTLI